MKKLFLLLIVLLLVIPAFTQAQAVIVQDCSQMRCGQMDIYSNMSLYTPTGTLETLNSPYATLVALNEYRSVRRPFLEINRMVYNPVHNNLINSTWRGNRHIGKFDSNVYENKMTRRASVFREEFMTYNSMKTNRLIDYNNLRMLGRESYVTTDSYFNQIKRE